MKLNRLTTMVILAMVLGVLVGYACHAWAPTPEAAKEIAQLIATSSDKVAQGSRLVPIWKAPAASSAI